MRRHCAPRPVNQPQIARWSPIRERRRRQGLSQGFLADSVGISFQQVQKYERGLNRVTFSRLVTIAQVLNCRVSDLVGELDLPAVDGRPQAADVATLSGPGALELLAAYSSAPPPMQRRILKLVVEIARHQKNLSKQMRDNKAELVIDCPKEPDC